MRIFTVYSKDGCPYCDKAVALLESKFETFNIVKITSPSERDDLFHLVEQHHTGDDNWKLTVPQIFMEGEIGSRKYIGGFTELDKWYQSQDLEADLGDLTI